MRTTSEVTRIVFENIELQERLARAEQVIYEHQCTAPEADGTTAPTNGDTDGDLLAAPGGV